MNEEQKKKNKIVGLTIGIFSVLVVIVAGTYAFWTLTRSQNESNKIISACLDFELSDVSEAISLESVYPMSESDIDSLTGYTFKVRNHCAESVNYVIGLNSVTNSTDNYLSNSSIRLKLDNNTSKIYGSLNDIEFDEQVRYSKEIGASTVEGNSENTHILKVWIDELAPITEQGKSFSGKVFITGGQGIESLGGVADSCYMITNEGTILGYDYACGTDVVVPSTINGIQVKKIATTAFNGNAILILVGNGCDMESGDCSSMGYVMLLKDTAEQPEIISDLKNSLCTDPNTCTMDDVETQFSNAMGVDITILSSMAEYNNFDFNSYEKAEPLQQAMDVRNLDGISRKMMATTLDLSNAIYLEEIEPVAFMGYSEYRSEILTDDNCGNNTDGEYRCTSDRGLTSLILPQNGMLTTIGEEAFAANKLSGTITIPSTVTYVRDSAFEDNRISKVNFPNTVTKIGNNSFASNAISKVVIPGSVTSIGSSAFEGNPLTEVIIKRASSAGLNIGYYAFMSSVTHTSLSPTYNPNYTE